MRCSVCVGKSGGGVLDNGEIGIISVQGQMVAVFGVVGVVGGIGCMVDDTCGPMSILGAVPV